MWAGSRARRAAAHRGRVGQRRILVLRAAMALRVAAAASLLATYLSMVALGCSDDGGGSGGGTSAGGGNEDDGKVRPPGNGVAIAEAVACAKVQSAFQDRVTALGCAGTARSCPDLIKAPSGAPACAQYDEGAADGCAAYVTEAADCDDVRVRLEACIVEFVEGSEPAGCP